MARAPFLTKVVFFLHWRATDGGRKKKDDVVALDFTFFCNRLGLNPYFACDTTSSFTFESFLLSLFAAHLFIINRLRYKTIKQKIGTLLSLPQYNFPKAANDSFVERVCRGIKMHLGALSLLRYPLHAASLGL